MPARRRPPFLASAADRPHNSQRANFLSLRTHDQRWLAARQMNPSSPTLDWPRVRSVILPFLWPRESAGLRARVVIALVLLIAAKIITVQVPFLFKAIVDGLSEPEGALLALPLAALLAYGLARLSAAGFSELRDAVFAKVAETAGRRVSLRVFSHLFTPVAPLPPGAAHRRARARDRARCRGDHLPARHRPVQHRPDPVRVRPGDRHPAGQVPLAVRAGHLPHHRRLRGLHLSRLRVADRHPARDEPARQRGQRPERRQPAQLRDGQDLHQRGVRARPSRSHACPLPERRDPLAHLARRAQFRPGRDHRARRHRDHDPRRPGRGRGHAHRRRRGPGQRLPPAALPAAQLSWAWSIVRSGSR